MTVISDNVMEEKGIFISFSIQVVNHTLKEQPFASIINSHSRRWFEEEPTELSVTKVTN